ncbi:MAG: hypothetical protein WAS21_29440 [Geminicoccaceae bacterium]
MRSAPVEGSRRTAVAIATTEGPAVIVGFERDTNELPRIELLNGAPLALQGPDFVDYVRERAPRVLRRHAGIEPKEPSRIVVTVDAPIDRGRSYELGLLCAMALEARGQLATEPREADLVLWATGEVGQSDGRVLPVDGLARKLHQSAPFFMAHRDKVRLLLPEPIGSTLQELPPAFVVRKVAEVLPHLQEVLSTTPSLILGRGLRAALVVGLALLAIGGVVLLGWAALPQLVMQTPPASPTPTATVEFDVSSRGTPEPNALPAPASTEPTAVEVGVLEAVDETACLREILAGRRPVQRIVPLQGDHLPLAVADGTCGIAIAAAFGGPERHRLLLARVKSGKAARREVQGDGRLVLWLVPNSVLPLEVEVQVLTGASASSLDPFRSRKVPVALDELAQLGLASETLFVRLAR